MFYFLPLTSDPAIVITRKPLLKYQSEPGLNTNKPNKTTNTTTTTTTTYIQVLLLLLLTTVKEGEFIDSQFAFRAR